MHMYSYNYMHAHTYSGLLLKGLCVMIHCIQSVSLCCYPFKACIATVHMLHHMAELQYPSLSFILRVTKKMPFEIKQP